MKECFRAFLLEAGKADEGCGHILGRHCWLRSWGEQGTASVMLAMLGE
jgi:hypothetical protein